MFPVIGVSKSNISSLSSSQFLNVYPSLLGLLSSITLLLYTISFSANNVTSPVDGFLSLNVTLYVFTSYTAYNVVLSVIGVLKSNALILSSDQYLNVCPVFPLSAIGVVVLP